MWPESWPKELEPLRKQARTYEGPRVLYRFYLIPFTKREEFEAAWPQLLKVKSKGVPIVLVRGPKTDFFVVQPAGVIIRTPPVNEAPGPENGVSITDAQKANGEWRTNASYIELVVDGEIGNLAPHDVFRLRTTAIRRSRSRTSANAAGCSRTAWPKSRTGG